MSRRNELKTLENDLHGRNRSEFGTVRPPGSNPGPPTRFRIQKRQMALCGLALGVTALSRFSRNSWRRTRLSRWRSPRFEFGGRYRTADISADARPRDSASHLFENPSKATAIGMPAPGPCACSSARRSLDKLADLFLDGGAEPLQGKGGWPDVTVVEVCSVLETERRVSRLELLPALEEADNLAVLGICGHPVPGFR